MTDIVSRLKKEGILKEKGKGENVRGRKPILLQLNEEYGVSAFVQIGYEEVMIKILNLLGRTIDEETFLFEKDIDFSLLLKRIESELEESLKPRLSSGYKNLLGVAFSIPAPIDYETGSLIWSRYYRWKNEKLPSKIRCCNREVMAIWENDSNILAYGASLYFGDTKNLLAFYLGIGIGAGIVIDGKVHRGCRGMAGEIGQFPIPYREGLYELERVISEESMIRFVQRNFPSRSFKTKEEILAFLESRANDDFIKRELQSISEIVAQFLSILVIALDPQIVVFDGEIVRYLPSLLNMVIDSIVKLTGRSREVFKTTSEKLEFAVYGAHKSILKSWFGLDVVEKLSER